MGRIGRAVPGSSHSRVRAHTQSRRLDSLGENSKDTLQSYFKLTARGGRRRAAWPRSTPRHDNAHGPTPTTTLTPTHAIAHARATLRKRGGGGRQYIVTHTLAVVITFL